MRRSLSLLCAGVIALSAAGCGISIPPKLQVRDNTSGRTYTTYEPWGVAERGVSYEFTDIETGQRIMVTNYDLKTLEDEKMVDEDSKEAKAFAAAKTRGGIK